MRDLYVVELRKKVGLVFYGVGTCGKPHIAVAVLFSGGIVPGGGIIVIMTYSLFENAEFYKSVAHHVRIWCKAFAQAFNGISYHVFPIFLVQVHTFEFAAIFTCNHSGHSPVFFL